MKWMLSLLAICAVTISAAGAQSLPPMPAGYDVGGNGVQGGDPTKGLTLQITPYNAGRELFRTDRFTIYERINYLMMNTSSYGDALCIIRHPGKDYQAFSSRIVVVYDVPRDEVLTRQMLWDDLRPVIKDVIIPQHCPEALGVSAHIFVKGWDVAADGQPYMPEAFALPKVQLEPTKPSDLKGLYNFRNRRAYDAIHGMVSEGVMLASFSFANGPQEWCSGNDWGQNCSFETFAPTFFGAPDQTHLFQVSGQISRARSDQERAAHLAQFDKVDAEYRQYGSFDGHLEGIAYRIRRNEYIRQQKAAREALINDFYAAIEAGMKNIEENGIGVALGNGGGGGGPCGMGTYAPRCIEDVIFIIY